MLENSLICRPVISGRLTRLDFLEPDGVGLEWLWTGSERGERSVNDVGWIGYPLRETLRDPTTFESVGFAGVNGIHLEDS